MNGNDYNASDALLGTNAYLIKVLNVMFPPAYILCYHTRPNSLCNLLNTTQQRNSYQDQFENSKSTYVVSTEPISRANLINFRDEFNASLIEHQAKQFGLCPIRRALFDQCFDEVIRQVTVGCIEQGLLLFRIRNELRMTLNYYRKAYESGVKFGLNKAIGAELTVIEINEKIESLELDREVKETKRQLTDRLKLIESKDALDSIDRLKKYYKNELSKRDQVIEQQRAIIKALSQSLKLSDNNS